MIAQCLKGLKSNSDLLYERVEHLIMNDLDPGYKSEDLAEVVKIMADSGRGSLEFYKE